jgi:hypothetical protein
MEKRYDMPCELDRREEAVNIANLKNICLYMCTAGANRYIGTTLQGRSRFSLAFYDKFFIRTSKFPILTEIH